VDPNGQPWASEARLTALVKTKSFEQALELIKASKVPHTFEHAYILHRLGKNKEALDVLKKEGADLGSERVKHLLSQVVRFLYLLCLFNSFVRITSSATTSQVSVFTRISLSRAAQTRTCRLTS
jgi:hypothetical protein